MDERCRSIAGLLAATAAILWLSITVVKTSKAECCSPRELREARLSALDIGDTLQASEEEVQQIAEDLAAIRLEFPQVSDLPYWPLASPGEILVRIQDVEASYGAVDALNRQFGGTFSPSNLPTIMEHDWFLVTFDSLYKITLLADIYSEIPGVLAEPNFYIGDGSTIIANPPEYVFRYATGDCPAGCIYQRLLHFRVLDGNPLLVPEPASLGLIGMGILWLAEFAGRRLPRGNAATDTDRKFGFHRQN